jgi:zinc and cadmium transporter
MNPLVILAVYCALVLVASLAGGWIPLWVRLTHRRLQVMISFVAGLMLGVGLLHLMPHAWHQNHSIDRVAAWLVAGFIAMFFIQRFLHFHHHDMPETPDEDQEQPGAAHPGPEHSPEPSWAEHSARRLSWTGAALGLTLHSLIEGVALAASVRAEAEADARGWLFGVGTFLVIFLHKPFEAMAIGTLMARGGKTKTSCYHVVTGLFALAIPIGALSFLAGAGQSSSSESQFLGAALAFSAGTFLCISTSDLLPELHFHAHDRIMLSLALAAGLGFSALISQVESVGHEWHTAPRPQSLQFTNAVPNILQP